MSPFERWFSCSDASGSHGAVLLITVGAVLLIAVGALLLIPSTFLIQRLLSRMLESHGVCTDMYFQVRSAEATFKYETEWSCENSVMRGQKATGLAGSQFCRGGREAS